MAKLAFALGEAHFKECQRSCHGTPSPQWPASRLPEGGVTHSGPVDGESSQHGSHDERISNRAEQLEQRARGLGIAIAVQQLFSLAVQNGPSLLYRATQRSAW